MEVVCPCKIFIEIILGDLLWLSDSAQSQVALSFDSALSGTSLNGGFSKEKFAFFILKNKSNFEKPVNVNILLMYYWYSYNVLTQRLLRQRSALTQLCP